MMPINCRGENLWPKASLHMGLSEKNPLLRLLYAGEKWIYKKADKLIFTMEGGKDYIVERGWDKASGGPIDISKVYHINNGVDLDAFDYNRRQYQIDDPDLKDANAFNVVYTGSIRRVNQVGLILDVAKIFKKKNIEDIRFLIWGDGDEKEKLQKRAKDEHLNNVCFKGHVDKNIFIHYFSKPTKHSTSQE